MERDSGFGNVGLGHRRLSIIDLSELGSHQCSALMVIL